jgi:hypothetical protein
MGATTDYLATLKIQLDAAALAKKAALDIAYERATNVQFDKEGKMSTRKTAAGNDAGPGTLDVQYAEQQRNIGSANESSGMLKSGEYARDLATSQAGYRSTVANLNADRVSGQTAIDTDSASEYAKYQAMYGKPTPDPTPTPTATPVAGAGAGAATGAATGAAAGNQKDLKSTLPPFDNPQNKRITSNIPSTKKPVVKKPVVTTKKTLVPVVKKPVGAWDR